MDLDALTTETAYFGYALFLVVCYVCYRLLQHKNYIILLLWPIGIYFCGPLLTGIFADAPVLKRYVFAENLLAETLVIFLYFVTLLLADRCFGISGILQTCISSPTIRRLSHGPAFLAIYVTVALTAISLEIKMLLDFGSLLTGSYVIDSVAEGLIPYWGFLAGLYEIIFLFFVLFILGDYQQPRYRRIVIILYCLTAILRVAGGTRLVLIKELAFLVILFYLQGSVTKRRLVMVSSVVLLCGSAVGLLRSNVGAASVFGPAYGLVMESGLNALTLNIAYEVQRSGFIGQNSDFLQTLEFLSLSAIPSFLRFSITQPDLDALSPYNLALQFGFDSYYPVGSMSGFATICYVSGHPFLATMLLAMTIGLFLRFAPSGSIKRIFVLVFCINAINFWRDPIDIAVKLVVQGVTCGLLLLFFSRIRVSSTRGSNPAAADEPAVAQ
jgi:hypothetical protein